MCAVREARASLLECRCAAELAAIGRDARKPQAAAVTLGARACEASSRAVGEAICDLRQRGAQNLGGRGLVESLEPGLGGFPSQRVADGLQICAELSGVGAFGGLDRVDFSSEANRLKFRDAFGNPVSLGTDGSTPTGTAPAIYMRFDPASQGTNSGTGGAFTKTGTINDGGQL